MTTTDVTQRLQAAVQKRDALASSVDKLKGRLLAAQENVAKVEQDCRDKGLDPARLDEAIEKLTTRYEKAVSDLEANLESVATALEPYENRR